MLKRLMTECEWRKRVLYSTKRPDWIGAQCVYPSAQNRKRFLNHIKKAICLLLAVVIAVILQKYEISPKMLPLEVFQSDSASEIQVRHVSAVSYQLPMGLEWKSIVLTRTELLQGKLMLLDEEHPLPVDAFPPNTVSILKYGNGMIPIRSLELKAGKEILDALKTLFSDLREQRIGGLYVVRGTMSKQQQKAELIACARRLLVSKTPDEAIQAAQAHLDHPGNGELLQEYTVDLCLMDGNHQPDERPLEQTKQGQALLQLSWRYGLIRSVQERPFRFRFVGGAHATAMTYLSLELKDYLTLLHQRKQIVVSAGGRPQYLILCQPISGERIAFDIPKDASYEVSLDNMGYAIVACTL